MEGFCELIAVELPDFKCFPQGLQFIERAVSLDIFPYDAGMQLFRKTEVKLFKFFLSHGLAFLDFLQLEVRVKFAVELLGGQHFSGAVTGLR